MSKLVGGKRTAEGGGRARAQGSALVAGAAAVAAARVAAAGLPARALLMCKGCWPEKRGNPIRPLSGPEMLMEVNGVLGFMGGCGLGEQAP